MVRARRGRADLSGETRPHLKGPPEVPPKRPSPAGARPGPDRPLRRDGGAPATASGRRRGQNVSLGCRRGRADRSGGRERLPPRPEAAAAVRPSPFRPGRRGRRSGRGRAETSSGRLWKGSEHSGSGLTGPAYPFRYGSSFQPQPPRDRVGPGAPGPGRPAGRTRAARAAASGSLGTASVSCRGPPGSGPTGPAAAAERPCCSSVNGAIGLVRPGPVTSRAEGTVQNPRPQEGKQGTPT